ncbi:hypothetical protein ACQ4PT_068178 [Festuca glaucescens]
MEHLIELCELETGRGANQIGTLQRPCDTRWSSHYASVCSLIKRYGPTFLVLKRIATTSGSGSSPSARAKVAGSVRFMMSFDFIFILHVMKELMGITYILCRKLQQKSQDIVNAMDDVSTTNKLIQRLRDDGWSKLITDVMSFCQKHGITAPNMTEYYVDFIRSRAEDERTAEHHYRYDIFTVVVDQQAHELNCRFSEQATELLILCNALDPRDSFSSLKIDDVCSLASKYYSDDFSEQEINNLRCQLQHYELDVPTNPRFQNLSSVSDLCHQLAKTGKSVDYNLIDRSSNIFTLLLVPFILTVVITDYLSCRLIRLVLTLPVSTAMTERAFSAIKLVKTRLRNKMEDGFLRDCLLIYIEKEIAVGFSTDEIIDEFNTDTRRVPFD